MKITELLNEIDYASSIPPLNIDVSKAKQVGVIDGTNIWFISDSVVEIYFFMRDSKITAYVAVSTGVQLGYRQLLRLENISAIKGSITALIAWLISKLNYKLQLARDEPLTTSGLQWITRLIVSGGRGFKITDQTGQLPDVKKLHTEWEYSRQNYVSGPTNIYIENRNIYLKIISEISMLSPCMKFIGDDTIE
jgi:hypothetical protein